MIFLFYFIYFIEKSLLGACSVSNFSLCPILYIGMCHSFEFKVYYIAHHAMFPMAWELTETGWSNNQSNRGNTDQRQVAFSPKKKKTSQQSQ